MNIASLIGIVVSIVIGVALIPVVTDTITNLDTTNMDSSVISLINILPIIVVTILIVGAVSYFAFTGRG
jgi:hypothetical protein